MLSTVEMSHSRKILIYTVHLGQHFPPLNHWTNQLTDKSSQLRFKLHHDARRKTREKDYFMKDLFHRYDSVGLSGQ